jgi:hypothetical protein
MAPRPIKNSSRLAGSAAQAGSTASSMPAPQKRAVALRRTTGHNTHASSASKSTAAIQVSRRPSRRKN